MGLAVHPSTVLRLVTALPDPEVATAPEILGIDDFALRKGQVYGTVLVDMQCGARSICFRTGRQRPWRHG